MKLNELLELNYSRNRRKKDNPTMLDDVYGIIYRIYCIPEEKSYVGQTFSHYFGADQYLCRHGLLKRCKIHYACKDDEDRKNRPLYVVLNKYPTDQFEVFEEKRLVGKELAIINQLEGEYMKKYNSLYPNGYNVEEVGKKYGRLLKELSEYHEFTIENHLYEDTTRQRQCQDICIGRYFKLPKSQLSNEKVLELLSTIDIESVKLTNSKGIRIIVRERGKKDNIRIYFQGTEEECLEYVKDISDNVTIMESFKGKSCYKYQSKLDKVLEDIQFIEKIQGKSYKNNARNTETYLLTFHGRKEQKKKSQTIHRVSFGGKQDIKISYEQALEFVDKLRAQTEKNIEYNLTNVEENIN
jgi:hypothetical protein